MDPNGGKHKLQFPPNQDDDEETDGLQDSRPPQIDDDEDEIGKFFALMDRIRATNESLKRWRATCHPAEATSRAAENRDVKIMTNKSPWKPSFEWEDFCFGSMLLGGHDGFSSGRDITNNSGRASTEIQNLDIGSSEGGKDCWCDKCRTVKSFDLNAEAPSEHLLPPEQ